jgi:hypothetical protein
VVATALEFVVSEVVEVMSAASTDVVVWSGGSLEVSWRNRAIRVTTIAADSKIPRRPISRLPD